jgi:hypothetical protein
MSSLFFKLTEGAGKPRPRPASFAVLFAAFVGCGAFAGYSAASLFPVDAADAHTMDRKQTEDYSITNLVVNVPGRGILRFDATVSAPAGPEIITDMALRDEVLRISLQSGMSSVVRNAEQVIPSFRMAMNTYLQHVYGEKYSIEIDNGMLYKAGI